MAAEWSFLYLTMQNKKNKKNIYFLKTYPFSQKVVYQNFFFLFLQEHDPGAEEKT